MFLENKYKNLYFKIIANAAQQNRLKNSSTYYELHHIIPRSIDKSIANLRLHPSNGILLTPREHFICHYLLCKMFKENTRNWELMSRAFTFMIANSKNQYRYVNSRLYGRARKNIGEIMSAAQSGTSNSQFGTVWMFSEAKQQTIKVNTCDIAMFESQGFKRGRVIDWPQYFTKKTQNEVRKIDIAKSKINRKIKTIKNKILSLEEERKMLESNLAKIIS